MRTALPMLVLVLAWLAATAGPTSDASITDLPGYMRYGEWLSAGRLPYSGFMLEYPPLSLLPFWAGRALGSGFDAYAWTFGALMLGALAAVLALAERIRPSAAWLVALSPILLGALVRTHFDALALVPLVGALLALTRGRATLGFALLGVGAMVKLFPAVAVPVAAAWLAGRGDLKGALRGVTAFAVVVLAISVPFLGSGYADLFEFHLERPVQIESSPASVLFALGGSEVTGPYTDRPDRFRSNGLEGEAADPVLGVFIALQLLALGAAAWCAWRGRDARSVVLASLAAVLAFVALGKVLSPQFVIWLVPLAALAWTWGERLVSGLLAAAMVLTQIEFPSRYFDLVARDPGVIVLVAVRNALLVAALVLILARLSGSARSSPPASAATP